MNTNYSLFVYGSLRRDFGHPAFEYIGRYFQFVAQGEVRGLLYDLGEYPAAIPTNEDRFIVGELYVIKEPGEFSYAIAQLDDYEGLNPEEGEELYRREIAQIRTADGTSEAWLYWYNGSVEGYPVIESGDMLAYLKEKYHR